MHVFDDISTPRLILRRISPDVIDAGLAGDRAQAQARLGASVPDDLLEDPSVLHLGRDRLAADPGYGPWSPRAIILADSNAMIGHAGFHSRPDPAYLHPYARDAVELGYTVFAAHRRRGYAAEAVRSLIDWAVSTHRIFRFVACVSPDNTPSLRLISRFGFARIGEHMDEVDGLEHIFLCDVPAPRRSLPPAVSRGAGADPGAGVGDSGKAAQ
jgi:RimJ/RimL family protein N-acetyltransferase